MKKLNLIALMTTLFCLSSTLVKANTLEMKGDTIPVFIGVLLSGSSNGGHHMPLPYQSPISVCYDSSNATLIFEGDNLLSGTAYSIYNDLGVSVCSGFILFNEDNQFVIDLSELTDDEYTLEFIIDNRVYIGKFSHDH
ncbi:MAG: DUF3244 domain-containing protein [Bacteroidaceae bacterium]|nr:DUF3244 domain-containing protein [Bacteroidaceae bacterium]MBR3529821.1 DUF3244 domain-containing protein [Bacteroidaceae bacterium]